MADKELPTINELKRLKVVDLKEKLNDLNLSTSGLKADLVQRLFESYQNNEDENQEEQEEERLKAEAEQKRLEEEAEQKRLEEEAEQKRLEEEAEQKRLEEEAEQKRLEEEAEQKRLEEKAEQKRLEEEAEQKRLEEEAEQKRLEEEAEQKRLAEEAEQQRLAEEAEQKRLAEEAEQKRIAEEAELQRLAEEAEQKQLAEEAEQKRLAEEAEQKRLEEETEQKRLAEEAEQKRLAKEAEQKRLAKEAEQKRLAEEAEQKRLAEEAEQKRLAEEAEQKRLEEETKQKRLVEEAEQKRLAKEAEQKRLAKVAEQKRLAEEAEQKRLAKEAEQKRLAKEAEQKRLAEEAEQKRIAEEAEQQRLAKEAEKKRHTEEAEQRRLAEEAERKRLQEETEKKKAYQDAEKKKKAKEDEIKRLEEQKRIGEEARKQIEEEKLRLAAEEDVEMQKQSKNKKKKLRRKKRARARQMELAAAANEMKEDPLDDESVDIEYVQETLDQTDPSYVYFLNVFDKFKLEDDDPVNLKARKDDVKDFDMKKKGPPSSGEDSDVDEQAKDDAPKLSKRKQKLASRMSVADLKQRVSRPDLVEMHDVTAKDPEMLLALKATRNSVPVPRHWCFKRKYLQGKRGIEKPPFDLPYFIKKTGIMEMRQALADKEDQKSLKAKMREHIRPKMGKIDVDYQKLHDAFFKWQTKPKMTIHGDLYYEGKEFETKMKDKKPGDLSDELRTALGMPVGPNCNKVPPPWLIAMQRYGPPPSYPNLKIPGLNAPIPDGCSFGYHAGGWGKPPVDEMGRPLYGDVFGVQNADYQNQLLEDEIDKSHWGALESESSESSEEEEEEEGEEEEAEDKEIDQTGLVTPAEGGLITPSGMTSIPAGMETPDMIELRKRKIEADIEGGDTPALYTILPEKKSEKVGAAMMGSTHVYDMSAAISKKIAPGAANAEKERMGVEVALDPSELDMDTAAMAARYEQTVREQESQLEKEDLSDMVAEHAAKQKNKRKKAQADTGKAAKRYKEFKF